ncbi:cytochrome P450 4C1 [Tribolium castaneum]|uniref:Cytochrome P450 349A1 n=1 Tax=Tribolium castaneum TaxID=7070 RepID=D2A4W1_TRICA|nr:PREDICTED: cytochrome P450 4C1 [Tribolium castaneum]EFA05711.1 cytochrome P450 349A1 [Tribolium castaneum]|eukprot:XP_973153.1 PREDICTED: cytochrome P450 4C1 [Tribolium castaneum]
MFLLLVFLSLCFIWCLQFHWKRFRLYKLSRKIPGPLNLPLIGCAHLFFTGNAAEIAKRFMQMFDDYPDLAKAWMGPELYYLITKPEYLEVVLNHNATLEKMDLYKFIRPIVGDGLISSPVKVWKRHRKIIAPTFNQKVLNEFPGVICEQVNFLIELLRKECDKGEIDHCRYVTNCAIDIVGETIFGVSIGAQTGGKSYSLIFDKWMEVVFMRIFRLDYQFEWIFSWTKASKIQEEVKRIIHTMTRDIIEKKKEQIGCQLEADDEKKKPFLNLLVEKHLNNELTLQELEDEVNTFLLAGSDTNATSGSFILTLLGMHQDVQDKLYEEVSKILGPERPPTLDDLPKLKYTERVIKESLRVFPGAPFVARVVEEDVNLGDVIVPKGANIGLGYLHLHRSEKYWKEPLKFDPDRFLPENSINRHPYTWLPFSGGSRNCIGWKYGMMVMKIMTAMVIRKFRVKSSIKSIGDIELTANVVLKPKNGFRLAFEMR